MKFSTAIIALSLAANVALAWRWKQQIEAPKAPLAPPAVSSPLPVAPRPTTAKPEIPVSPTPQEAAPALAPIVGAWSRLQSENLKEYVARLRAAGCPEETVQDIIMAEVGRLFAARRREANPDPGESKWWKSPDYDSAANRERSRKYKLLAAEESAMLVDLLGVDPTKSRNAANGFYDYRESQVSFLPEEKRAAVGKVLDEYDEKRSDMYQRNGRIHDAQSRIEQKALEQEQLTALSQVLSPDELRQWKLRNSQTATQLQYELLSLPVTEDIYKKIFDVRDKYGDSIYNWAGSSPEERDAATKAKDQMQKDLQAALGPELAQTYERSQDYNFKQLTSVAKKYDLPPDTANKIYDVKTAAEDAVKKLNSDQSLSDDDRQTALKAIRDETENTVKAQMGDKAFKSYQNNGGYWINSISARRAPRPAP